MEKKLDAKELQEKVGQFELKKSKLMEEYKKADYDQQCCLTQLNELMIEAYKKQAAANGIVLPKGGGTGMNFN